MKARPHPDMRRPRMTRRRDSRRAKQPTGAIPQGGMTAIRGPVEETGNPDLTSRVLAPYENTIPESARYSLFHLGRGLILDHVLVSRSLGAFYRGAEIHNEVLPTNPAPSGPT